MKREPDPAELFPPGFYDRMKRLADQPHQSLRVSARAEFDNWLNFYKEEESTVSQRVQEFNRATRRRSIKVILGGGVIAIAGFFIDKNMEGVGIGGVVAGIGGAALLSSRISWEPPETRRVRALETLLPSQGDNSEMA